MPTSIKSLRPSTRGSLKTRPTEDMKAARPTIPNTVAPSPTSSRLGLHPSSRPKTSPEPSPSRDATRSQLHNKPRRDSGLAPSSSTARESHTTIATDMDSVASLKHSPSLPRITIHEDSVSPLRTKSRKWGGYKLKPPADQKEVPRVPEVKFLGITTDIPTSNFEDLTLPGKVEFSKRGSMLIGGKRANEANGEVNGYATRNGSQNPPGMATPTPTLAIPFRTISADDEMLSQKVRSMYEGGTGRDADWATRSPSQADSRGIEEEYVSAQCMLRPSSRSNDTPNMSKVGNAADRLSSSSTTLNDRRGSMTQHQTHELAGGLEDWEDVNSGEVDRYGFIVPRRLPSQGSSLTSQQVTSLEPARLQRVSTSLQLASETPRRQRSRIGRTPSTTGSTRSALISSPNVTPSRRPPSSHGSDHSTVGGHISRVRSATNRLPHNRDRRWKDEAADMLTLPPGLADIAEHAEGGRAAMTLKRKEWEREEKWRKMGKVVPTTRVGGGMVFEFDTNSPKLIERTWKGIPDRWRATAWHAFLTASAKKRRQSPSDQELIATFHELIDKSSPDDVQIDIDVPRTINSHIMFRRRYRGGQRLLFRVLHCLSIYFPDTGYVQGMAALAATLLCYYDEEMTFVMLVRLWQLRGLARLYQSGFEGLMEALDEFEKTWLAGGEVATKLTELGISPTAYGTRWYLTLFNYSIPFPAQLRVWDVFMLLGDADTDLSQPSSSLDSPPIPPLGRSLDVLHATSAALIDGTREILLDSDFENAMKVLTSWIPIRDPDLLMRVAKAEWKVHRRKR